jgi:prepilin-type N-terminal cleavage/methylation domain-containing protein
MRLRNAGFTLIELLIVVVIIGILAAIAIPKFSSTREKAFLASMKSDLRNLATLQDIYHNNNYTYSTDLNVLGFVNSDGITVTVGEGTGQGWRASSAHAGYPGETCALFNGTVTGSTAPATIEGQIACT